ncbi:MAG: hypothetical protein PWP31_1583 [Clostridia bacterium]|nr:hypothetical protein [Clostridia bacterium]
MEINTSSINLNGKGLKMVRDAVEKLQIKVTKETTIEDLWFMMVCVMGMVTDQLIEDFSKQQKQE